MVLFYSWEPGAVGSGSGHALALGSGLITKATLERWRVTQRTLPSMPGAGPRPRGTSRKLFALLFSQMSNACVGEEFIANCFFPLMPHHYSEAWKAKSLIILFKVYKCPKEQGILLLRNVA